MFTFEKLEIQDRVISSIGLLDPVYRSSRVSAPRHWPLASYRQQSGNCHKFLFLDSAETRQLSSSCSNPLGYIRKSKTNPKKYSFILIHPKRLRRSGEHKERTNLVVKTWSFCNSLHHSSFFSFLFSYQSFYDFFVMLDQVYN